MSFTDFFLNSRWNSLKFDTPFDMLANSWTLKCVPQAQIRIGEFQFQKKQSNHPLTIVFSTIKLAIFRSFRLFVYLSLGAYCVVIAFVLFTVGGAAVALTAHVTEV